LQESLKIAKEQKDQRTTALIGKFIDAYYRSRNPFGFNIGSLFGDDDEDYEDEDEDDALGDIFGHLPEEIFTQIAEKTIEISKKTPRERLLKSLAADYLSNNVALLSNLVNDDPDILFAFLLLKTADGLGIDIDVTAEEIIECFEDYKDIPKAKPFPFF